VKLPERTSAAQLSCYARCPRKYRFKYVDGFEPEYRSVSMALGSVVHGVVQWWFERRRDGVEPTMETAMEILSADFAAATHDEIRWGQWTPSDLRDHAARLVRTFIERFGELKVVDTEMSFDLDLYDPETGECARRPLRGYFDFYLGAGRVLELKTARTDYGPLDLTTSMQFGAYLMAIDQHWRGGEMDVVVLVKNRTPRVQQVRLRPNPRSERWFLTAAFSIERAIEAGLFPPAPGYGCSGCEYQRRCLGATEHANAEAA
jgi:CRISPR/Cas system-associated exonuclease Cas4 (RecB family)